VTFGTFKSQTIIAVDGVDFNSEVHDFTVAWLKLRNCSGSYSSSTVCWVMTQEAGNISPQYFPPIAKVNHQY
jgi:hypothetical protein